MNAGSTFKELAEFPRRHEKNLKVVVRIKIAGIDELVHVRSIGKYGGGGYPDWYLLLELGDVVEKGEVRFQ
jgi:hypothetical protein